MVGGGRPRIEGWIVGVGLNLVTVAVLIAVAWGAFTGSTPAKIDGLKSTIDATIDAQQRDIDRNERRADQRMDRIEARVGIVEQGGSRRR